MDGFKDTTRMKYMMGGDVKAYKTGGAAMKPVDEAKNPGLSKLPTSVRNKMGYMKEGGPAKMAMGGTYNEKGKRATLAEMEAEDRRMGSSMPAKKAVGPSSVAVSKVLAGMAKKAARMVDPRGAVMEGDKDRYGKGGNVMKKKGVPAYSGKPMVGRKTGGLMAMPKGKC